MRHQKFIHLHNHTEFSLLDGASRIPQMVSRAAELEMPALGITDHGSMYGAISFYKACRAAGIKPIIGFEAYVAPRTRHSREAQLDRDPYHLTLLAADAQGYRNLMRLCSLGQMEGMYYKPRIDREVLAKYSAGLICLSGCLAGEVATKAVADDLEGVRETIATYRDIFGADRYLLEVQRHGIPEQEKVNQVLLSQYQEFGLRLIGTNDLHYVHQHDAKAHDVLLCLQTGNNHEDVNRWRFDSQDFYLKTPEAMSELFVDLPGAVSNTLEVAEQVGLEIDLGKTLLPPFEVPPGHNADSYLCELVEKGVKERYGESPAAQVLARMEDELTVIRETGYSSYFLIVWDFFRFAREQGVVTGPGRGSAAGSLVAYSLGITNLDPLAHGLLFERFLNRERVSMPDIDSDFSVEGREKVIRYVTEKYGAERVAQIITFTTMASKAAIRDVGRVLKVPLKECDQLAKLVPVHQGRSKSLKAAMEEVPDFRQACERGQQIGPDGRSYDLGQLIEIAQSLEGVSRNVSVHAAGVVIAPDELVNYSPLQHAPRTQGAGESELRQVITQYDMKAVGDIGLLKMDFLGLQNLDIISGCLRLIKEYRGIEIDLQQLDYDHPSAYELISKADTHGVFQLEGSGMRRMLEELKPSSLGELAAAVALFRPGPMQFIPAFIARKQGREQISYMHPQLEAILGDTYGVIVYQEQVMMAARELAGFTLSEADILRSAMGKKDKLKMAQQKKKFLAGCKAKGMESSLAEQIFETIAKFAEYGFPRAHAVAYAMITFQTAYLKANYPIEYMTSLLIASAGNADKVAAAIVDCNKRQLKVLPPEINQSGTDFTITPEGQIRFGLAAIKNVGRGAVEQIVRQREAGDYRSLSDLCERLVGFQEVNSRALEALVRSGACDQLGERGQLLANLEIARKRAERLNRERRSGQLSLFGGSSGEQNGALEQVDLALQGAEMLPEERLRGEKELLGLYLSGHPLNRLQDELEKLIDTHAIDVNSELKGNEVRVGGLVREMRRVVTRKGQIMGYGVLEDLTGPMEVTLFPKAFAEYREIFAADKIVIVQGTVDVARSSGRPADQSAEEEWEINEEVEPGTVLADLVWAWGDPECRPVERECVLHINVPQREMEIVDEMISLLARYPGRDEVLLHFKVEDEPVVVEVGERFRVDAGPALQDALDAYFGRSVSRLERRRPIAVAREWGNGRKRQRAS